MTNIAATQSFDRMRSMLVRAAEIRDSEQQQIFDALDEIHARLAPLESLGSVRKRLSEMPDRTEVSVLAERIDEALSKLEAQDGAIAALGRAVESIIDKLAKPFAELGGRLDGMAGRFEGVAGRMDGLEDRIAGLHKRIDDVDHHLDRQDTRVDGLPAAIHGPVREQLGAAETGFRSRLDEVDKGLQESLAGALESLTHRLDVLSSRLDAMEEGVGGRFGSVSERLGALDGALAHRPDGDSLFSLIR
ncbi:MAG TPA: PA containing protein, partial [Pseudonocardiaceae bacterium]